MIALPLPDTIPSASPITGIFSTTTVGTETPPWPRQEPRDVTAPQAGNRHERRKQAALARRVVRRGRKL